MAQLQDTTINGILTLMGGGKIDDVELYLKNISDSLVEIKESLNNRIVYPDYANGRIIIPATSNDTSYTITEDGFVSMSALSSGATLAWYMQINGKDVARLTIYGYGKAEDKHCQGPFPVKKGDIIRVFGGVNLKATTDTNFSGIMFYPIRK